MSILETAQPESQDSQSESQDSHSEQSEASWYWDESQPGVGERPEWLKEKYTKVVDQAKAYNEAEKMLGSNRPVPESYDLSEYNDMFDIESDYMQALTGKAKEHRLSEEAVKDILNPLKDYYQSLAPDLQEEVKKLGENAQSRINTVNTWASNNLSPKALETLGNISNTADVIEMMDEIRQIHHQTQSKIPANINDVSKPTIIDYKEVEQEIIDNYSKYKESSTYREKMNAKLRQAVGED